MLKKLLATSVAAVALTGCQTWGPNWSELSGNRFNRVPINTSATVIRQVDGESVAPMARGLPIRVVPGKRQILLDALPLQPGFVMVPQYQTQTFTLDIEPCKRYWINARFASPVTGSPWEPFVDRVETIVGCDPAAKAQ